MIFKRKIKDKILVCTMVLSLLLSVNPIYSFGEEKREVVDIPSGASFYHKEMIGKDRYETSNKILKEMGDKNETVILVNASEIMSDGLSSSALAGKLKANIVPINPKKVNKNTMEKVKKAKTVYLIGGYNAIPKSFESNLKNKKVIRIGGKDRVETSEKIAKYIGSYKKAYIVNGYTGQADAMSISPVAARDLSPIILTKKSNSETPKKDNVEYTVIGGKNAVSEKIRKRFSSKRIDGKDRYETNRNVLKKFYPNRKSISFCNGETLVDALSGTVYAKDEGIALVNRKNNLDLLEHISTSQLGGLPFDVNFVYGGSGGTGGTGGSGGGTGGGTVVPEENKLETPKLEANITGKYENGKGEVILNITNKDKYPKGTEFEYSEKIPKDNLYEVGKYSIRVKAKLKGKKDSEWSEPAEFTVHKEGTFATLVPGSNVTELPEKPEDIKYIFGGKINEIIGDDTGSIKLHFEDGLSKVTFEERIKGKNTVDFGVKENEILGYSEEQDGNKVVHIISQKEINTNPNASFMFAGLNIKSIEGLENIDTHNTTNMMGMFLECSELTSLNLSKFDTRKVTNMSVMFAYCSKLTRLDLSEFKTSQVTNMIGMFSGCSELTSLNLIKFDTSKVTDMSEMFANCEKLTSLDLSEFKTSQVTNMMGMFSACSKLTSLNLSKFDTSKVTDMSGMFSGCEKLTSLDLSNFNTSKVTNMGNMFSNCTFEEDLDLSKFNTSNVEDISSMFFKCTFKKDLNLSGWDIGKIKETLYAFWGANINQLILNEWRNINIKLINSMISQASIDMLKISDWDMDKVTDISGMLEGFINLKNVDLRGLDTSKVTDMSGMFKGCTGLTTSDSISGLDTLDTSKVTNMSEMFRGCTGLTTLDSISGLDTSEVTNMSGMFKGCTGLKEVDLSGWDTNKVTDMSEMFMVDSVNDSKSEESLVKLNLSDWNTSYVTNMSSMFSGRYKLINLNLSNWVTSKVSNMSGMFKQCINLVEIPGINKFDFRNVTDMSYMFKNCDLLNENIYINDKEKETVNCDTIETFRRGSNGKEHKIIVHYNDNADKSDVKNFIENNLSKNNPSNNPLYNVEYKVIKNDAPTM